MKKIALVIITLLILLSVTLTGCSSGIPQTTLDAANAKITDLQTQLSKAQADLASAKTKQTADEAALNDQIKALNKQITDLKAQYVTTGANTLETVTKMAKAYHDSHYYIRDVYDCNNYAADFWDMLKQINISSVIVIGSKDKAVTDILASDHAWVLVDLGNGEKVVVDPTGGMVVKKADNPLYYQGWTFNTPGDLKANDDLKAAYNARVNVRNTLAAESNKALDLYNSAADQTEMIRYLTLYDKLEALKADQETILRQTMTQINSFSTRINL
jgi:hypothetical protein